MSSEGETTHIAVDEVTVPLDQGSEQVEQVEAAENQDHEEHQEAFEQAPEQEQEQEHGQEQGQEQEGGEYAEGGEEYAQAPEPAQEGEGQGEGEHEQEQVQEGGEEGEAEGEVDVAARIQDAVREVFQNSDMTTLKMSQVHKALKKMLGKPLVKANKEYIEEFVKAEIVRQSSEAQGEDMGEESEADLAPKKRLKKLKKRRDEEDDEEDYEDYSERKRSKRSRDDDEEYSDDDQPKRRRGARNSVIEGGTGGLSTKRKTGPTKPRNAYTFFSQEHRETVREENPDATFGQISKRLSEMWKGMSKSQREPYEQLAKQDKQRYSDEWEEFSRLHPEQAQQILAQQRKKSAGGGGVARKKGEAPGSDDEGEGPKKEMTVFDEVFAEIRSDKKSRKKKDQWSEEEMKERAETVQFFVKKMEMAAAQDVELNLAKKPAINKLKMLDEVVSQASKIHIQETMLDFGLLRAIKEWLTPLPDGSLPNIAIRTALFKLLGQLPVGEDRLRDSGGLGHRLNNLYQHASEAPSNKALLRNLFEKWLRPMFGQTTDYRELANAEEEKAREMRMRKQQLGEKGLYPVDESKPSKRARIPQPVAFDYAVRPQIARDAEEEVPVFIFFFLHRCHYIQLGWVVQSKPSKRARIPQPVAFDYAVRPQIARDAEEEVTIPIHQTRVILNFVGPSKRVCVPQPVAFDYAVRPQIARDAEEEVTISHTPNNNHTEFCGPFEACLCSPTGGLRLCRTTTDCPRCRRRGKVVVLGCRDIGLVFIIEGFEVCSHSYLRLRRTTDFP